VFGFHVTLDVSMCDLGESSFSGTYNRS